MLFSYFRRATGHEKQKLIASNSITLRPKLF